MTGLEPSGSDAPEIDETDDLDALESRDIGTFYNSGFTHREHPEDMMIRHNEFIAAERALNGIEKYYVRGKRGFDVDDESVVRGLDFFGIEVVRVDAYDEFPDLGPKVGVHLGIYEVWRALEKIGKPRPSGVDYPKCLSRFYGRYPFQTTLAEVRKHEGDPVFVKPVRNKAFAPFIWGFEPLREGVWPWPFPDETEVWASNKVAMLSEHRAFVLCDEILDVRRYKGAWSLAPDKDVVEFCVASLARSTDRIVAYCLDFAVLDTGETVVVEMNDGFAFGGYGLNDVDHARMICARWKELTT